MPGRKRLSKFSQLMPSDSEVYAGGERKQAGYGKRILTRTVATQTTGLVSDSVDQYREMSRDGLQYGDPDTIRYCTGREDAKAPKFDLSKVRVGKVGTGKRMRQK